MTDTSPYEKLLDVANQLDQWAQASEHQVKPMQLKAEELRHWVEHHRCSMTTGYVHRARLREAIG